MMQSENGTYHWTGVLDREYEEKQYRIVWVTVGITCLFLTALGGFLCIPSGDWEMFAAFLLPCVAALGITFLVIRFSRNSSLVSIRQYGMSEDSIWMGSRRSRAVFAFVSAKHVVFTRTYIEPLQAIGGFRIYVPEEDMAFVKSFVMSHLPAGCDVDDRSYES